MKRTVVVERSWAVLGAQAKVNELQAQIDAIIRQFPEVARGGSKSRRVRGKRNLPSNFRKTVSDGMRRYWARRKAKEAKSGAK